MQCYLWVGSCLSLLYDLHGWLDININSFKCQPVWMCVVFHYTFFLHAQNKEWQAGKETSMQLDFLIIHYVWPLSNSQTEANKIILQQLWCYWQESDEERDGERCRQINKSKSSRHPKPDVLKRLGCHFLPVRFLPWNVLTVYSSSPSPSSPSPIP